MLRNSYFDQYQDLLDKNTKLEKELSLYTTDLNRLIFSQRPMSTTRIKNLPPKILPVFIDDVMCDINVNTLLYSSNANKEIYFYLKQKKSLLNSNINPLNSPKKKKELSALGAIMANRSNLQVIKSLKSKIDNYFNQRNEIFEKLRNKQELFLKSQPMIKNKLEKLYYKPINEIKIKGYERAFNQCLNRSLSDQKFNLPDIKFNMNDVYSRLFNNAILNQNILRDKILQKKKENEKSKENIDNKDIKQNNRYKNNINLLNSKNNNLINSTSAKNSKRKKVSIKTNNNYDLKNRNYFYYSKLPAFNVANIIKSAKGKEFNIRITPRVRQRCWSTLSGGPRSKSEPEINLVDKNEENKNEEIDYKELRNKSIFNINKSKSKNNINNIILYNTLNSNKYSWACEFIKVRNYRDANFNSNLHIAVKNNSIKLVNYFLNKKLNPNDLNKDGQTPLHLALKGGNKDIIDLLMKNGADINIKDNDGKKPFDYGSKEIIKLFQLENQK